MPETEKIKKQQHMHIRHPEAETQETGRRCSDGSLSQSEMWDEGVIPVERSLFYSKTGTVLDH